MSKIYAPLKMLLKLIGFTSFFGKNEVDNLNEISLEDANVTYFDNCYIGCSICRQRKCTGCKVLLLADSKRQEQKKEFISKDYMSLFDDTNRRLSAITELCYAVTTLAVEAYNAVLSDSEIRVKFLASDKQRCVLLKRCCIFLLHQLLFLGTVVSKTMKTLH